MDREEAIRKLMGYSHTPEERAALEVLIPELRESEDERIRQGLVKLLTVAGEAYVVDSTGIKKDSYLAYLEKQKESLHISETCKENANSFTDEDERIRRTLVEYFGLQVQLDFVRGVPIQKIRDWLEKQKEEEGYEAIPVESTLEYKLGFNAGKEARWRPTEEQVDALERTVRLSNFGCDKERRNALLSLLEQLKQGDGKQEEQKPAEWSDEDKKMLNELITIMDGGIVTSGTYLSEYAAWLKSLRGKFKED